MANPTTNFGWVMPNSADLVTDLPADFAVFGQGVDTTLVDLKGGTTGQVLSKATNTDMDFSWVTTDDANAIQNAIVDAKGDLISATASDTPARLAVGTNGYVLTADSAEATGLKWNALSTSGLTKIVTADFSASAGVAVNGCFTSTYTNYIVVLNALGNSAGTFLYMQMQYSTSTVETSANYYAGGKYVSNGSVDSFFVNNNDTKFTLAPTVAVGTTQAFSISISNVGNSSQSPVFHSTGNGAGNGIATAAGLLNLSRTYTGFYLTGSGNLTGTYTVYGLAK